MFELTAARRQSIRADVLSGLTVALALVPEAVAFAFVAGVPPKVGLTAAFFVCLITAVLGGRPGMISGATGALAVVAVGLVQSHGLSYLLAAVVLMGVLQIGAGLLNLGRFVRLVPHPVMLGFVNGLAIVIALAQLGQFGVGGPSAWAEGTVLAGTALDVAWLPSPALLVMLGLVGATMAIIYLWPKLTKAVPAPLVAIVAVAVGASLFGLDTRRVGDVAAIGGALPSFSLPAVPLTFETLKIIFPTALVMASVGLIESLLTLTLVDEITQTKGSTKRECLGQGAANVVTGFFGGMGGCAMIGQSMINVTSGGRGRLSGITAALALLAFTLWLAPLIELIPVAALIGVMFVVVIGTFEWSSFRILRRIPAGDAAVLVLVSGITVATDLAVAVAVGVVASALVFAWEHAKHVHVTREDHGDVLHYEVRGPLFFGAVQDFLAQFDAAGDPDAVEIDFHNSLVCDHSALEAIDTLASRYEALGKRIALRNLSQHCQRMLARAGHDVQVDQARLEFSR